MVEVSTWSGLETLETRLWKIEQFLGCAERETRVDKAINLGKTCKEIGLPTASDREPQKQNLPAVGEAPGRPYNVFPKLSPDVATAIA